MQHVFELEAIDGTMAGFRFPDYAAGIEVSGWHLHFVSKDRNKVIRLGPGQKYFATDR